jgi:glycosyltransferase involved in cell wall biosynthesis
MICPNTSFLSHGKICEKCKKNKYFWPSFERCKKDSFSESTMAGLESSVHRMMRLQELVDCFIAPSKFLKQKLIEYGFPGNKVKHLDLFTDIEPLEDVGAAEDYYLFVGRIAQEKGLKTLIDVAVDLDASKLKIVGSGPLLAELTEYAASIDKNNRIEFMGYKNREEIINLYDHCKYIVVPSEWYEPSGLIIFEAFALSKPVIGSRIGGIPELVRDTERGLVFESGDKEDLAATIKYMLNNPDLAEEMGRNAKIYVEQEMSPEKHYEKLIKIYEDAIQKSLSL